VGVTAAGASRILLLLLLLLLGRRQHADDCVLQRLIQLLQELQLL
jgi:hypothetical protein